MQPSHLYNISTLRQHVLLTGSATATSKCQASANLYHFNLLPQGRRTAMANATAYKQALSLLKAVNVSAKPKLVPRPDTVWLSNLNRSIFPGLAAWSPLCLVLTGGFEYSNQIVSNYGRKLAPDDARLIQTAFGWFQRPHWIAQLVADYVKGGSSAYLAVHWRFDEGFCRYGINELGLPVRTSTSPPNKVCFHSWTHNSLTWVPLEAIVSFIATTAAGIQTNRVYVASDNQATVFRAKIGSMLKHQGLELLPMIQQASLYKASAQFNDNLEHSLLEQELCLQATAFIGTSGSTWSSQVSLERYVLRHQPSLWLAGFANLPPTLKRGFDYFAWSL
jgi:hypothetical protein